MRHSSGYVSPNRLTAASWSLDPPRILKGQDTVRPTLPHLACIITRDANLTFGGGTATSEVLRRSLVKRRWMTDHDHRRMFALSRLTPGTNLLAYCTATGWATRGLAGAAVAWLASSIPSSLLTLAARAGYEVLDASPPLRAIVLVAMSVAVLLLASSAWHLAKPFLTTQAAPRSIVVIVGALALAVVNVTPIGVLLCAAVVGALWPRRS